MTESRSHDTFMLMCPACGESLCLNDAINKYGSTELKQKWHETRSVRSGTESRIVRNLVRRRTSKDRTQTPIPGLSMDHSKLHARALLEQHKNENNGQI